MQTNIPIVTVHFNKHDEIRNGLLHLIAQTDTFEMEDPISRCDFTIKDEDKKYTDVLFPAILPDIKNIFENVIKYTEWEVTNYWFQQYNKYDAHQWHWHKKCFYQCIYYLELPEGTPGTELELPITGEKITPDVKEGDILIIPTILRHRSMPNPSDKRKTVIAINIE